MKQSKRVLALVISGSIMLVSGCATEASKPDMQPSVQAAPQPPGDSAPVVQPPAETLDQLVAPIALYPDALVAHDIHNTVKARYDRDTWLMVGPTIFDKLRRLQRDALVAFTLP